jgi:hypothetical protein
MGQLSQTGQFQDCCIQSPSEPSDSSCSMQIKATLPPPPLEAAGDLLAGIGEWRNIQDVVRITFKAFHDVLRSVGRKSMLMFIRACLHSLAACVHAQTHACLHAMHAGSRASPSRSLRGPWIPRLAGQRYQPCSSRKRMPARWLPASQRQAMKPAVTDCTSLLA